MMHEFEKVCIKHGYKELRKILFKSAESKRKKKDLKLSPKKTKRD
jgi:hypothetical protein